jgi:hypothetical protein
MPAQSYGREWLDALLDSSKQHTTRPRTNRIKVGDVVNIYIEQRRRILDKPLRRMTEIGIDMMYERGYPMIPAFLQAAYPAHFLGKVLITDVYDVQFCEMTGEELEAWAWLDGFKDTDQAEAWFQNQYGDGWWFKREWTGIGWHGWVERYFSAGELKIVAGDV